MKENQMMQEQVTIARLKFNWVDIWEKELEVNKIDMASDFYTLIERVKNQNYWIEVCFMHGDIFEIKDNNYWLPNACFMHLPTTKYIKFLTEEQMLICGILKG